MNPWEAYKREKQQKMQGGQDRAVNTPWTAYKRKQAAAGLPLITRKYNDNTTKETKQTAADHAVALTSGIRGAQRASENAQKVQQNMADSFNRAQQYRQSYDAGRDTETVRTEYQQAYDRARELGEQIDQQKRSYGGDSQFWLEAYENTKDEGILEQNLPTLAALVEEQKQAEKQLRALGEEMEYANAFYYYDNFNDLNRREGYDNKSATGERLYSTYQNQIGNLEMAKKRLDDVNVLLQYSSGDPTEAARLQQEKKTLERRIAGYENYAADISMLSDEEKKNYYYLLAMAPEQAAEYYNIIRSGLKQERLQELSDWAGQNFGTQLLASLGSTAALGVAWVDPVVAAENEYAIGPGQWRDTLRGGVAQKYNEQFGTIDESVPVLGGQGVGNLYQLGMSMADSAVAKATMGKYGTIALAGAAMSSAFNEARDNGASFDRAFLQGLAQGVAEGLFEYVSIDKLMSQDVSESFIKNALKQAGVEATEEAMAALSNEIMDRVIMQDQSTYDQAVQKYVADGMTLEQAQEKAGREFANRLAQDALGGFLSGAGMTAGNYAGQAISERSNIAQDSKAAATVMMELRGTDTYNEAAKAAGVKDGDSDATIRRKLQRYFSAVALGKVKQETQATTEPTEPPAGQNAISNETEAEAQKTSQNAEVFIRHGFSDDAATAAGAVIDKGQAGEHITNKDIDKLNLFTSEGVAAVNEALGTNMQQQSTASNMRKALREAVAQYQTADSVATKGITEQINNQNVQGAETRVSTEAELERSDATQRVIDRISAGEEVSTEAHRDAQASVGAAKSGFDPYSKAANEYGTIEPGENPTRIVDVPKSTTGEDRVGRFARTAMEAGVTPDSIIPKIEESIMFGKFSHEPERNQDILDASKEWVNRFSSADSAYTSWIKDASKSGTNASYNMRGMLIYNALVEEASKATSADYRSNLEERAVDVLAILNEKAVEAGRAIQILRMLKALPTDKQIIFLKKSVQSLEDKLNGEYGFDDGGKKKKKKKKDSGKPERINLEIDEILLDNYRNALNSKNEAAIDAAKKAIISNVVGQVPKTFKDYWDACRYLNMLGNPKTIIRNVLGNTSFTPIRFSRDKIAALIELTQPKDTRTKYLGILNASEKGKSLLEYAKEDFKGRDVQAAIKKASGKYRDGGIQDELSEAVQEHKRSLADVRVLGKIQAVTDWAMNNKRFGDEAFLRHHYKAAFAQAAMARGYTVEQIKNGTVDVTALQDYAVKQALKATFRDVNALTRAINRLQIRGNNAGAIFGNTVLQGLLPFRSTPANVLLRSMEYSPIGLLKSISSDIVSLKKGNMTAAQWIENLSQGLTGSALYGLGMLMLRLGWVTGGGQDEDDERTGKQGYSLKIGDVYIPIDWLAPSAVPFFMGVETMRVIRDSDSGASGSALLNGFGVALEPLLEMSMLSGVGDMISSLQFMDEGVGSQVLWAFFMQPLFSYAGQLVPTIFSQAANALESEDEYTYVGDIGDQTIRNFVRSAAKITEKIPFVNWRQEPYVDAYGRTQEKGWYERYIESFIAPTYVSVGEETPVDNEIARIEEATGEELSPTRRGYTITVKEYDEKGNVLSSEKIRLSGEQHTAYTTAYGQQYAAMATALVMSETYQNLTDDEKAAALAQINTLADEFGKYAAGVGYEIGKSDTDKKLLDLVENGLPIAEAYAAKLFVKAQNESDEDGDMKALEFAAWVDEKDWTQAQKNAVIEAYGNTSSKDRLSDLKGIGISSDIAGNVVLDIGKLEPAEKSQTRYEYQKGKAEAGETVDTHHKTVQTWQKLEVIANNNQLTEKQQWEAMKLYTDSKLVDEFRDNGIAPWVYAAYLMAQSEQDTGSWSQEKLQRWLSSVALANEVKEKILKIYKESKK